MSIGSGLLGGGSVGVRTPRWWAVAAALTLALMALGCGGDKPSPAPATGGRTNYQLPDLLDACTPGQACKAGLECVTAGGRSRCMHLCQSDADCGTTIEVLGGDEVTLVCTALTPQVKACDFPCTLHEAETYACIEGHRVYCTALDETSCMVCGCPDHLRCEQNVGCMFKRALDEKCLVDRDCISNNCDAGARVCRVAVGSPCTATNCQRCMGSINGTFCSRNCTDDYQCNGQACSFQRCVQVCAGPVDSRCPGECKFSSSGGSNSPDIYACDCPPMECVALAPPPDVGSQCNEDSDCGADGVCLLDHPPLSTGVCSLRCSVAAPCSVGRSCVEVPCGEGDPVTCGSLCLRDCAEAEPRCGAGSCRPLPSIDAQSLEVCDYRKPGGEFCEAHNDCQSSVCFEGVCNAPL